MATALANGRAEDERWHVRKDGTRFFASGGMSPIYDGDAGGFVKIARDQTQKLIADAAMLEKQQLSLLVSAQEGERQRIARNLHDQLGQQLTALRLTLEGLGLRELDDEARGLLTRSRDLAMKIDQDASFLAWELRPAILDDMGLRAALGHFVREWSQVFGISASFHTARVGTKRLVSDIEVNLYRVAQEALNNIVKHAEATEVSVILEGQKGGMLVLIVEDNGKGIDNANKDKTGQTGACIGLLGMAERAALLEGRLDIESSPGKGTTIYARVPLRNTDTEVEMHSS